MLYNNKWHKRGFFSLFDYFSDFILFHLPLISLSSFLQRIIYGFKVDFIFVVHPRRSQDYYVALPFLSFFRKRFPKAKLLKIIQRFPPFVLAKIKTKHGVNGLVISSLCLPKYLMKSRNRSLVEAKRVLKLCKKVGGKGCIIGLGAWWPIITGRGKNLVGIASANWQKITNGHTVTILSIVMTIEKIAKISSIPYENLRIAIVGGGKIGSQVGSLLINRNIKSIAFIDINGRKLDILRHQHRNEKVLVETFLFEESKLHKILNKYHIGVCATSSTKRLIKEESIPDNFIFIDDSRPEAVEREMISKDKIVIEGGGMKFPGLRSDYDFGMGIDDNVFGCLGEAIILAMDKSCKIEPSIADIDMDNLNLIWEFCLENNIFVADFKNRDLILSDDKIRNVLQTRYMVIKNECL